MWTDLKENIAGHFLMYNSKNFHWLNENLDLERTSSDLGKPFLRKLDIKVEKKQKLIVKMPHVNKTKNTSRKSNLIQTKTTSPRMNYEWIGKPFGKQSDRKNWTNCKNIVKLPHENKKPLVRKLFFVQTPFSKVRAKNFHAAKPLAFCSTSFGVTGITTPIEFKN